MHYDQTDGHWQMDHDEYCGGKTWKVSWFKQVNTLIQSRRVKDEHNWLNSIFSSYVIGHLFWNDWIPCDAASYKSCEDWKAAVYITFANLKKMHNPHERDDEDRSSNDATTTVTEH